jgi:hypothetical protein
MRKPFRGLRMQGPFPKAAVVFLGAGLCGLGVTFGAMGFDLAVGSLRSAIMFAVLGVLFACSVAYNIVHLIAAMMLLEKTAQRD